MRNIGAIAALFSLSLVPASSAQASITCTQIDEPSFEVCHAFSGTDGQFPEAGLTADNKGNLYITTFGSLGGSEPIKRCSKSCGSADSIFVSDGSLKVLHHFQAGDDAGSFPASELVVQKGRVIYGTAEYGPHAGCDGLGCGTVFQIVKHQAASIFRFCSKLNCQDGAFPRGGLIADGTDGDANLFGTAMLGGKGQGYACGSNTGGCGVVYELSFDGTEFTEEVLHDFCQKPKGNVCTDGAVPLAKLYRDQRTGVLYGTTQFGGANDRGTVFQLVPDGTGGWIEGVLYSFCSTDRDCSDGAIPQAGVIADASGDLYGTAAAGGINCNTGLTGQCGVAFELTPKGDGTWTETVLHTFTGLEGDGAVPQGTMALDQEGNLYGTTLRGGSGVCEKGRSLGCGTVFAVSAAREYSVIHSFGIADKNSDGVHPEGALLLQDGDQHLYGSTRGGGDPHCACGTVYRIDLDLLKRSLRRQPSEMIPRN